MATLVTPAAAATHRHHRLPTLTGRVINGNHAPIAGARVRLSVELNPFAYFSVAFSCALTFSTSPSCMYTLATRTDRNGAFTFSIDPKWLVGKPGTLDELFVDGHPPAAGLPAATTDLDVTMTRHDPSVGTAVLWQPTLNFSPSNGRYP